VRGHKNLAHHQFRIKPAAHTGAHGRINPLTAFHLVSRKSRQSWSRSVGGHQQPHPIQLSDSRKPDRPTRLHNAAGTTQNPGKLKTLSCDYQDILH
jgi:hypothetical protein